MTCQAFTLPPVQCMLGELSPEKDLNSEQDRWVQKMDGWLRGPVKIDKPTGKIMKTKTNGYESN